MTDLPSYVIQPIPAHPRLVQNYGRQDLRFVRGSGCWLIDEQERRFLDCLSGIAVNILGHSHPAVTAAICRQAGLLLHTSNLFHVPSQERLAELLCAHSCGQKVFFCNSGTEANEAAFKVVRLHCNQVHGGRKPRVIAAQGSFHGRTLGALSLTANPHYREGFAPLFPVEFVPYGDGAALQRAMADDVAGVFLEPLQGEGGVRVPPSGYLALARELCDRHAALLCFDEVQTGCGRTGTLFAYEHEGVVPDCLSLAKGLAGGVPIGALLLSDRLAALLPPGSHASTFGGNHLACAAGVAVLEELLKPGFLAQVKAMGERFRQGLPTALGPLAGEIRGRGLLIGAQLDRAPTDLIRCCQTQGLIVGSASGNVLRLAPPLIISVAEVDEALARLEQARRLLLA